MTHSYRWANAAKSLVLRSDGAYIPADPANADFAEAQATGIGAFVRWGDINSARNDLLGAVEARARALRLAIAGADASKRDVYSIKYETARAALGGDAAARQLLAGEAAARGESVEQFAELVKTLGGRWRAAALAIDATYQGHKAAIAQLEDLDRAEGYDPYANWPPLG